MGCHHVTLPVGWLKQVPLLRERQNLSQSAYVMIDDDDDDDDDFFYPSDIVGFRTSQDRRTFVAFVVLEIARSLGRRPGFSRGSLTPNRRNRRVRPPARTQWCRTRRLLTHLRQRSEGQACIDLTISK